MIIKTETNFEDFKPWAGAVSTHRAIVEAGKAEIMACYIKDAFQDGINETELNDMLWFESEEIFEMLGI